MSVFSMVNMNKKSLFWMTWVYFHLPVFILQKYLFKFCVTDTLGTLPAHAEETDGVEEGSTATDTPEVIYARPTELVKPRTGPTQPSLAHVGRPIPQVSHIPDPVI